MHTWFMAVMPRLWLRSGGGIGCSSRVGSETLLWSPSQMMCRLVMSGMVAMSACTLGKNSAFFADWSCHPAVSAPSACETTNAILCSLNNVAVTMSRRPEPSSYWVVFVIRIWSEMSNAVPRAMLEWVPLADAQNVFPGPQSALLERSSSGFAKVSQIAKISNILRMLLKYVFLNEGPSCRLCDRLRALWSRMLISRWDGLFLGSDLG